ncbi:hypothetical protein QKU48_gp1059 [Fadolivirus algeromassiliense]|jgi:hypothetical protein|uniref:Uncharacterized protein n=1 Tax=Fadolivirus FV1/VV64 TaxID=3070911 RepID=A0A7D3V935_9VIRU|nr:hypothetical protein QKU48_gp1059 [Fadolivirus algeromassiliense]QKF94517.1 hypothetical protein Fadolivirus_1_1059 [Fadolivirus FV1/VV64]
MVFPKKFKKVLRDNDLKDLDTVKEYLSISFQKRRSKKDYKIYINICKIYNQYPETIKDLLDCIPKLGYYKDYFYILMFSRNNELSEYIYDIVIKQLNEDLQNLKEGKQISTIGKWLPRENSKINQQCHFIDVFNSKFFPDCERFNARKRYRKLKTMLNDKIGTIEAKICTKQMDKIDFSKVSHNGLERNKETILKDDMAKVKLDAHIKSTLKRMSMSEFIKEVMTNMHDQETVNNLWEHNRFSMEIPYINRMMCNSVCIIDLSKDTYNDDAQYFAIGMALLTDQFSTLTNKTFVCNDNMVKLTGGVKEKIDQLTKFCGPCKPINISKYYDLVTKCNVENPCKNILFVSNKEIQNIEWLADKKMTLVQFKPYHEGYDIVFYNGTDIKQFRKYTIKQYGDNEMTIYENKSRNIKNIIDNSDELNDRQTPVNIILILFFIVAMLKLYGYLFIY